MCQHWLMKKSGYHHGDLRSALVDTGLQLLGKGGPAALVAREATRVSGVSVTALYRHFESVEQWRAEVSRAAREELARTIIATMEADSGRGTRAAVSRRRFRACGEGYIQFALDHPQLFAGAFTAHGASPSQPDDPSPYAVLEQSLDDLVDSGLLQPKLRRDAPTIAWTAVHGLAALIAQGAMDAKTVKDHRIQVVLDAVAKSLGVWSSQK